MNEVWKDVIGWEGWYEISNQGRIRRVKKSLGAVLGRILKPKKDRYGYYQVNLWRNNAGYWLKLHRIVAMAFLGLPQEN